MLSVCSLPPLTPVPAAPLLHLEPLNCTSVVARWQKAPGSVVVQGYRLSHHEEGRPEQPTVQLPALLSDYTISNLGESLPQGHTPPQEVQGASFLKPHLFLYIFWYFLVLSLCQGY